MLDTGLDPDIPLHNQYGSILNAGIQLDFECLAEKLIYSYANVNVPDELGRTSIFLAERECNPNLVQELLWYGADLDIRDHQDNGLLIESVVSGCQTTVIHLIHAGIDINSTDRTMFHASAAQVGLSTCQLDLFETFVAFGIDLSSKNMLGCNILDTCLDCMHKQIYPNEICYSISHHLLLKGARLNDMRYFPFFPDGFFTYADLRMFDLFCSSGLRLREESEIQSCMTHLHEAYHNPDFKIFSTIISQHNVDINLGDMLGNTVAYLAASGNDVSKLHQLASLGADFNCTNSVGQPPLIFAIEACRITLVFEWLLSQSNTESIMIVFSYVCEFNLQKHQFFIIKYLARTISSD
ncbi:hypothetical protein QAD02_005762 [Eretmocerus hayati]|uniref:Uncharacterized protein n=1 Tax=Eretmocerus hayati TaxID=131215 RepID=A0ACC2NTA8_9HYME|nr:hypothetical protein QAD02_005762 [Eretmocerus hayati]